MALKFLQNKRKILKGIIGGFSLTTALFIFQACYGTPQDVKYDTHIKGIVKSSKTLSPIKGIKVSMNNADGNFTYSDEKGEFYIYTELDGAYKLKFEDADSTLNGSFVSRDTTLSGISESTYVEVLLEEK